MCTVIAVASPQSKTTNTKSLYQIIPSLIKRTHNVKPQKEGYLYICDSSCDGGKFCISSSLLKQEQISSQLAGKKFPAKRMSISVQLMFKNDGSVAMKMPIMSGIGTWRFKGKYICMNMKNGPRRNLTCMAFEHI